MCIFNSQAYCLKNKNKFFINSVISISFTLPVCTTIPLCCESVTNWIDQNGKLWVFVCVCILIVSIRFIIWLLFCNFFYIIFLVICSIQWETNIQIICVNKYRIWCLLTQVKFKWIVCAGLFYFLNYFYMVIPWTKHNMVDLLLTVHTNNIRITVHFCSPFVRKWPYHRCLKLPHKTNNPFETHKPDHIVHIDC